MAAGGAVGRARCNNGKTRTELQGTLRAAGTSFAFALLGFLGCLLGAAYDIAVAYPSNFSGAFISLGIGFGLLVNGLIIKGLVRLAVNVANDIFDMANGIPLAKKAE